MEYRQREYPPIAGDGGYAGPFPKAAQKNKASKPNSQKGIFAFMDILAMKNIGPAMKQKLNAIGLHHAEELTRLGSKEAFLRLKVKFPNICLVHLYTLQGAIDNLPFYMLPQAMKDDLKAFSDGLQ